MRKNNRLLVMFIAAVVSLPFNSVESVDSGEQEMPEMPQTDHPSKELVIAVLTIMFSVTLLLLAYVKFCRVTPNDILNPNPNNNRQNLHGLTRSGSRFSGIEREVIETLPFFKFSSLKGSREGLECTVCLSKFEDSEVLRLLPKCRHAFHVSCIDTWLESHSTCPLCRHRVEAGDIKSLLANSPSSGFLRVPSNLTDDPNLEIYVQREPSSQFEVELGGGGTKRKNYEHRIVVSDVVNRSRWSDLNSSDLISLSFEMLDDVSSARFDEEAENSFTALNPAAEKRSMSEIPGVARFVEGTAGERVSGVREYSGGENVGREERMWRIWMPIARRTVQWFARRERNSSHELRHHRHALGSNV